MGVSGFEECQREVIRAFWVSMKEGCVRARSWDSDQ